MPAVDQVRGEAHIDRAALDLLQPAGNDRQVLRIVHLRAEQVPHVQRRDIRRAVQSVQGFLGIDGELSAVHEGLNLAEPLLPVVPLQAVQGLGRRGVLEEVHADLHDLPVPEHGLEVLLRQGQGRRDRHAGGFAGEDLIEDLVLKDQVAVHEQNVVIQNLPGEVDAVDIVRDPVIRIMDKGVLQRQVQARAVVLQDLLKQAGGDDHLLHARLRQLGQLPGQDRLPRGDLRHALGMLRGEHPHAAPHARIQDQRFQVSSSITG